jgi:pyridoxamine 5'-phosphate oxidase family protein
MSLTQAEIDYLDSQQLGRLATIQPDGSPQVKPIGFRYNRETGTIDIGGFGMSESQKFRNVIRDGRAALVVDDVYSTEPWRVRFLEIRGPAEAVPDISGPDGRDRAVIRLHPRRVLSFGIEEPPEEPHRTRMSSRTLS